MSHVQVEDLVRQRMRVAGSAQREPGQESATVDLVLADKALTSLRALGHD
jgi:hypothetical protein